MGPRVKSWRSQWHNVVSGLMLIWSVQVHLLKRNWFDIGKNTMGLKAKSWRSQWHNVVSGLMLI
jgi:hypothetical protein